MTSQKVRGFNTGRPYKHDGQHNCWFPAEGLSDREVGAVVAMRRLVDRNGRDVSRYLTDYADRVDDHVANHGLTSIYDGARTIVEVRRNANGDIDAVRIDLKD